MIDNAQFACGTLPLRTFLFIDWNDAFYSSDSVSSLLLLV